MSPYLLFVLIFILLMVHGAWMALFALEAFFETSRETAAERASTLAKYIFFGFGLEVGLGASIWFFVASIH